jgi:hypothetical protein
MFENSSYSPWTAKVGNLPWGWLLDRHWLRRALVGGLILLSGVKVSAQAPNSCPFPREEQWSKRQRLEAVNRFRATRNVKAEMFHAAPENATMPAVRRGIPNIKTFLDACPQNDPAFSQITQDFKLRRDGVLVSVPPCTEPVSQMPVSQYTDELIVYQGLRTIYYMDRGMAGHLPWTAGTLYDWMKSKIGGINLEDVPNSFCCEQYDERYYIVVKTQDDFNREFDKAWRGISGNIALYAHETRHVDGFPHDSCCGITAGCDSTFSTANLSPYGIQWWLNKLWLDGTINVGYACLDLSEITDIEYWLLESCNGYILNFC